MSHLMSDATAREVMADIRDGERERKGSAKLKYLAILSDLEKRGWVEVHYSSDEAQMTGKFRFTITDEGMKA